MTTMAHFSGTCPDCGERWQPGDLIRAQAIPPGESPIWKHAACPAPTLDLDRLGPTDSELESPTPLAEQIAREHHLTTRAKCACPDALDAGGDMHAWVAHIATVTERAAREKVAQEIEAARTRPEEFIKGDRRRRAKSRGHANFNAGMTRAARIARGGTHA